MLEVLDRQPVQDDVLEDRINLAGLARKDLVGAAGKPLRLQDGEVGRLDGRAVLGFGGRLDDVDEGASILGDVEGEVDLQNSPAARFSTFQIALSAVLSGLRDELR